MKRVVSVAGESKNTGGNRATEMVKQEKNNCCDGCGIELDPGSEGYVELDSDLYCVWCWNNDCCGITGDRRY